MRHVCFIVHRAHLDPNTTKKRMLDSTSEAHFDIPDTLFVDDCALLFKQSGQLCHLPGVRVHARLMYGPELFTTCILDYVTSTNPEPTFL